MTWFATVQTDLVSLASIMLIWSQMAKIYLHWFINSLLAGQSCRSWDARRFGGNLLSPKRKKESSRDCVTFRCSCLQLSRWIEMLMSSRRLVGSSLVASLSLKVLEIWMESSFTSSRFSCQDWLPLQKVQALARAWFSSLKADKSFSCCSSWLACWASWESIIDVFFSLCGFSWGFNDNNVQAQEVYCKNVQAIFFKIISVYLFYTKWFPVQWLAYFPLHPHSNSCLDKSTPQLICLNNTSTCTFSPHSILAKHCFFSGSPEFYLSYYLLHQILLPFRNNISCLNRSFKKNVTLYT